MPLTKQGYRRPSEAELLAEEIANAKALFGDDLDTGELTIMGKSIRYRAYLRNKAEENAEALYHSFHASSARGEALDRLTPFAGISREPATYARHRIKIIGSPGGEVPMGFLVSTTPQGVLFYTIDDVVIGEDGATEVAVDCESPGIAGNLPVGSIDLIVNPDAAVDAIEHIARISDGEDAQGDTALRQDFTASLAGSGETTMEALRSAILRIPGVRGCDVIQNVRDAPYNGLPAHSYAVFVLAPEEQDQRIFGAIYDKGPMGIESVGDVETKIHDASGTPHIVRFSRIGQRDIFVKARVLVNNFFAMDSVAAITQNIIDRMNALASGAEVYLSLLNAAFAVDGVLDIPELLISGNGADYAAQNILCGPREVARTDAAKISIEVVRI